MVSTARTAAVGLVYRDWQMEPLSQLECQVLLESRTLDLRSHALLLDRNLSFDYRDHILLIGQSLFLMSRDFWSRDQIFHYCLTCPKKGPYRKIVKVLDIKMILDNKTGKDFKEWENFGPLTKRRLTNRGVRSSKAVSIEALRARASCSPSPSPLASTPANRGI